MVRQLPEVGLRAETLPRSIGMPAALADRITAGIVGAAVAAYALLFSFLSIHRHNVYETDAFDLANMEQAVWNTTQGRPLDFTNFEGLTNRLGAHVEPILIPISAIYALVPRAETLLVIQSVVVALGALPVAWLARRLTGSRVAAVVFPLVYLLFPALEAANLYDFHALTLTPAFFAFAIAFAVADKPVGYWASIVLAMSSKEDVPLMVAALGIWVAIGLGRRRQGLLTVALAVAWFVIAVQVVIPYFNPEKQSPYLDTRYGHLGANLREIVGTLLFRPDYVIGYLLQPSKLAYIRDLLTPVAFLSVLAPVVLFILTPTLVLILLSGSQLQNTLELEHYPAPLVPIVVISAIFGVATLSRWLARRSGSASSWATGLSIVVLLFTLGYHWLNGLTPLAAAFTLKERTAHHEAADRIVAQVPSGAGVSATGELNAHLAARRVLYVYPKVADADWVAVDFAPNIAPIFQRDRFDQISQLRRDGFGVVAADSGYLLLAKGRPDSTDPAGAFRQPVAATSGQTRLAATFDDGLTLTGYDVGSEGRGTGYLTLYLRADRPMPSLRLFSVLLDGEDRPLPGSEAELVAPIWFPTDRWEPGQTYAVETRRWVRTGDGTLRIGLLATRDSLVDRLPVRITAGQTLVTARDRVLSLATIRSDGRRVLDQTPARLSTVPARTTTIGTSIGGSLLVGAGDIPATCRQPCRLSFDLFWLGATPAPADVFVHIVGTDGRPLAQHDGPADGGRRPSDGWLIGEIVQDRQTIDAAAVPPGEYRIVTGLYDPVSGARLGDPVPIGSIRIER